MAVIALNLTIFLFLLHLLILMSTGLGKVNKESWIFGLKLPFVVFEGYRLFSLTEFFEWFRLRQVANPTLFVEGREFVVLLVELIEKTRVPIEICLI
jgi:hypothetical protein